MVPGLPHRSGVRVVSVPNHVAGLRADREARVSAHRDIAWALLVELRGVFHDHHGGAERCALCGPAMRAAEAPAAALRVVAQEPVTEF